MRADDRRSILCFGEVLLRLSAAHGAKLANSGGLSIDVGGAEANVGAMLAQLGHDAEMITVLPTSPLGELCRAELHRTGLGTTKVIRADGRLGLYFFERGTGAGGGRIVYDRKHSAFVEAADRFDWPSLVTGSGWLHLSGISLALGERAARSALSAVEAMRSAGGMVSFDVNHRSSLWQRASSEEFDRLRTVCASADVLFASPGDISRLLEIDDRDGAEDMERRAAETAFDAFNQLQLLASTRRVVAADEQRLSAFVASREAAYLTRDAILGTIVDRIGSGDAFAAGVIDGLLRRASIEDCARSGLAAAVMKHGLSGDRWIGTREELDEFDPFGAADIRR